MKLRVEIASSMCFRKLFPTLFAFVLLFSFGISAGENATPTKLQCLLALTGDQPLAFIGVQDIGTLPAKLSTTQLLQMYNDPAYAQGSKQIDALLSLAFGAAASREFWDKAAKLATGPMVLALTPEGSELPSGLWPTLHMVAVDENSARELEKIWPSTAADAGSSFVTIKLKTVLPKDLATVQKIPEWAQRVKPSSDIAIGASPRKAAAALKSALRAEKIPGYDKEALADGKLLNAINLYTPPFESVTLNIACDGSIFSDELNIELPAKADSTFASLAGALREKPHQWDSFLTNFPGKEDIALLAQTDPAALRETLPFAAQAAECYLRGRRWTRSSSKSAEAQDPKRFQFIFDMLNGDVGIVAHPSRAGEVRVIVAAAVNSNETEATRTALAEGLNSPVIGGAFHTMAAADKIGAAAPLGTKVQTKGIFASPVIGLSQQCLWLCSNAAIYQDLAGTLAGEKNLKTITAADTSGFWRDENAVRMQVNLEKIASLAYTIWTLSGQAGPAVGSWRIPNALLPTPQVVHGHLGGFRAALSRSSNMLNVSARCAVPGSSLLLLAVIQDVASAIDEAHAAPVIAK